MTTFKCMNTIMENAHKNTAKEVLGVKKKSQNPALITRTHGSGSTKEKRYI